VGFAFQNNHLSVAKSTSSVIIALESKEKETFRPKLTRKIEVAIPNIFVVILFSFFLCSHGHILIFLS